MEKEHHRLNLGEEPTKIGINEERECYDRIEKKCSVPSLVVIPRMVEYQKPLHKSSSHVCRAGHQSLPCYDSQPSCEVAQEFAA